MPGQKSNAKQVSSMGETPAEARHRMASGGADAPAAETPPPLGQEVKGPLTAQHLAAISAQEEGFSGTAISGGTVEDAEETTKPPSPSKAMEMIRQLGQEKIQVLAERDAAIGLVDRYKAAFGELD